MLIRQPAVAGRFYPDGPEDLRQEVRHFLDAGAQALPAPRHTTPVALMLPHAGHVFCGHVIGATLAGMRLPRTLILLCPNHTGMGRPLSVWPDGAWLTPLGPVTVDASLAAGLSRAAGVGLVVLFRAGRSLRENLAITGLLFAISAAAGIALSFFF